ncbi:MAG: DUF2974 domain-containing protein [Clostridia bacterium]|nr:DUF2974 domain-containing protein [Clostridia bacterium]
MNSISNETKLKANIQAIYITYLYLSKKVIAKNGETLSVLCERLEENRKANRDKWSKREIKQLKQLKSAIERMGYAANSKLQILAYLPSGMTACVFENQFGELSFVFKGTGDGEWADNGEGLTGYESENTYITYESMASSKFETSKTDYATRSQAEAFNWFNCVLSFVSSPKKIIVSGHSKGGNKAQFITLHSPYADECYSFNGQGFSPEAVKSFEKNLGPDFDKRRLKMHGICANDDYVSALGKRIIPDENMHFFESENGIHGIDAILNKTGALRDEVPKSRLSKYAESISDEFLSLSPGFRKIAASPLMSMFEKYLGNGKPINMSNEEIIGAIAVSAKILFKGLKNAN